MIIHSLFLEYKKKNNEYLNFILLFFHLFIISLPIFVQLNFSNFTFNLVKTNDFLANFLGYEKTLIAPISILSSFFLIIRFIFLKNYFELKKIFTFFIIAFFFFIFIKLNYGIFQIQFLKTYLSLFHLFAIYICFSFFLKKINLKKKLILINFFFFVYLFFGTLRIIDFFFITKNYKLFFNFPIYNVSDYYVYALFFDTLILIFFYKSKIIRFFLLIFFTLQIYSSGFDNNGLNFIVFVILPLFIFLFYIKSIRNFIITNFSVINLFLLFCIINFLYLIFAHLYFNRFVDLFNSFNISHLIHSLEERFRILNYIIGIQDINLFNFLFPNLLYSRILYSGYAHNDFLDMYFNIGIFSLFIYYIFSKKIFNLFKYNNLLGIIIFLVLLFGSIVQNNILNIYLHQHIIFLFLFFKKNIF
jgi:hypothetical protein